MEVRSWTLSFGRLETGSPTSPNFPAPRSNWTWPLVATQPGKKENKTITWTWRLKAWRQRITEGEGLCWCCFVEGGTMGNGRLIVGNFTPAFQALNWKDEVLLVIVHLTSWSVNRVDVLQYRDMGPRFLQYMAYTFERASRRTVLSWEAARYCVNCAS